MSRLTGLEEKIRSHLQGNLDGNHSSSDHIEDNHSNSDHTEDNIKHHTEPNNEAIADLKLEDVSRESEEGTERPERKISFQDGLESGQAEVYFHQWPVLTSCPLFLSSSSLPFLLGLLGVPPFLLSCPLLLSCPPVIKIQPGSHLIPGWGAVKGFCSAKLRHIPYLFQGSGKGNEGQVGPL